MLDEDVSNDDLPKGMYKKEMLVDENGNFMEPKKYKENIDLEDEFHLFRDIIKTKYSKIKDSITTI